jgi:purine-binding chemotaxis protein CheW
MENQILQLVSFKVGDEVFAASIMKIQEIIKVSEITKIPRSPGFVRGVINLRGRIIPVIDLRERFGLPAIEDVGTNRRIVVAEIGDIIAGLEVDEVAEVIRANALDLEKTPMAVTSVDQKFISGILKRSDQMLIMLDVDNILDTAETAALRNVR